MRFARGNHCDLRRVPSGEWRSYVLHGCRWPIGVLRASKEWVTVSEKRKAPFHRYVEVSLPYTCCCKECNCLMQRGLERQLEQRVLRNIGVLFRGSLHQPKLWHQHDNDLTSPVPCSCDLRRFPSGEWRSYVLHGCRWPIGVLRASKEWVTVSEKRKAPFHRYVEVSLPYLLLQGVQLLDAAWLGATTRTKSAAKHQGPI